MLKEGWNFKKSLTQIQKKHRFTSIVGCVSVEELLENRRVETMNAHIDTCCPLGLLLGLFQAIQLAIIQRDVLSINRNHIERGVSRKLHSTISDSHAHFELSDRILQPAPITKNRAATAVRVANVRNSDPLGLLT